MTFPAWKSTSTWLSSKETVNLLAIRSGSLSTAFKRIGTSRLKKLLLSLYSYVPPETAFTTSNRLKTNGKQQSWGTFQRCNVSMTLIQMLVIREKTSTFNKMPKKSLVCSLRLTIVRRSWSKQFLRTSLRRNNTHFRSLWTLTVQRYLKKFWVSGKSKRCLMSLESWFKGSTRITKTNDWQEGFSRCQDVDRWKLS